MAESRTIQDLLDELTPAEKDLQALIVGAALEDEAIGDSEIISQYEALSDKKKYLLDFLVGNILAERSIEHSLPLVDNFLSHYGVKGMKWGVQKSEASAGRSVARSKVKLGAGTMGDAHKAALKSNGHRAINAFTGDKTFWKRMAVTAGIATVGLLATGTLGPTVLPESLLSKIGESIAGPGVAGVHVSKAGEIMTNKDIGDVAVRMIGATAGGAAAAVATAGNVVGNTSRAIRGNAKIQASYAALGKNLKERQTAGSAQTRKLLVKEGSLRDKDLKHDNVDAEEFLEHFGVKGMKWGVRNVDRGGSTNRKSSGKIGNGDGEISKDEVKAAGIAASKIALKYGAVPVSVAVGASVGLPAVAALGISIKALQDPTVQAAASAAGTYAKNALGDMRNIPMPKLPKIKSPFGTKTTSRDGDLRKPGEMVTQYERNRYGNLVPAGQKPHIPMGSGVPN